jgi:hypothetical protein
MTRTTRSRAHLAETSRHILESLRAQQKADLQRPAFGSIEASDDQPGAAFDTLDADDFDDENQARDIQSSRTAHMDNIAGAAPWRGHSRIDEWIDAMDSDQDTDFPWDDMPSASDFPEPRIFRHAPSREKSRKPLRSTRPALFFKEPS